MKKISIVQITLAIITIIAFIWPTDDRCYGILILWVGYGIYKLLSS